jgi:hydroxymethylpyrimidine pyrophosphatase-like HAD family hydrolase
MNNNPICWIFDIDGVITSPQEKQVTQEGLIEAIAKKIDTGDIVTLNTGRSITWTNERVLIPLLKAIKDKTKLTDIFIVGEKGGSWAYFENNMLITKIDETCKLPDSLRKELKELIEREFSDCMFYDESKLTLISLEMNDECKIADYSQKQLTLVEKLKEIVSRPEYKELNIKVEPSIIAVDIQAPKTGKHLGARKIESWIKEKQINPSKLITLGDSQADTEMAEELQNEYPVVFVFTGDPAKLDSSKLQQEPIITKSQHEAGTLEFLASFSK